MKEYLEQSKKWSFIEILVGLIVGLLFSIFVAQPVIFDYYDIHNNVQINTVIAVWFTLISLARGYMMRRFFVWLMRVIHIKRIKKEEKCIPETIL